MVQMHEVVTKKTNFVAVLQLVEVPSFSIVMRIYSVVSADDIVTVLAHVG